MVEYFTIQWHLAATDVFGPLRRADYLAYHTGLSPGAHCFCQLIYSTALLFLRYASGNLKSLCFPRLFGIDFRKLRTGCASQDFSKLLACVSDSHRHAD